MRKSFKAMVDLHKLVIHDQPQTHTAVCTELQGDPDRHGKPKYCPSCPVCIEEKYVNALDYGSLDLICKECFGATDENNGLLEKSLA